MIICYSSYRKLIHETGVPKQRHPGPCLGQTCPTVPWNVSSHLPINHNIPTNLHPDYMSQATSWNWKGHQHPFQSYQTSDFWFTGCVFVPISQMHTGFESYPENIHSFLLQQGTDQELKVGNCSRCWSYTGHKVLSARDRTANTVFVLSARH